MKQIAETVETTTLETKNELEKKECKDIGIKLKDEDIIDAYVNKKLSLKNIGKLFNTGHQSVLRFDAQC